MELFRLSVNRYIGARINGESVQNVNPPLKVFIFRSQRDFRMTVKAGAFAGFMYPSMNGSRLVFGPQPGNRYIGKNALHEYTHYLVRDRVDVSYPLWYEEGLASFLSTLEFANNQVLIGAYPNRARVRQSLNKTGLRLAKVVDTRYVADWRHDNLSAFYDWSWLLVHYLNFGPEPGTRRQQLEAYLSDPNRGFERAFGTTPKKLEGVLKRYLKRPLSTGVQPLPEHANAAFEPIERVCLSDAERNFELSVTMMEHNPKGAVAVLEKLLEQDYAPVETLVALSAAYYRNQQEARSLQSAEDALSRDGTHVSARIQLASVLIGNCLFSREIACVENWQRAIPLLRSAMRSDPERFDAIYNLGLTYLHSGQAGDAINYLRVAYTKAPWSPRINFYLGEGYRLIGDRRAKTHLINARNWASSDIWRRMAEVALENLD